MQPHEGSNAPAQFATRVDPITGAVIQGALENIAIEMGHKLMRMSYSSIIRESEDFGAALTDADGNQLCECKMSTPLQSGPIPGYVRGIKERFAARGDAFRRGDVIMHNDPYGGASHGPDVAFCVPVFDGEKLLGFSVTTAHHLDIGAHTPGSCGIVDAVDAYAEGLQFKAIKVVDQGRRNDMVWHMIRDNIRIADLVVGDMEAQIAAAQIGARRYLDLVRHYGLDTVTGASADLMDYSERLMRAAIREIPDGVYSATTFIDGFLDDADPSRRDLKICVTITVKDDEMLVDLAGTAPQVPDRPINMPFEGTVDCAVWLTLRSMLLDSVVYGPIPQNSGLTRPITIAAPKGCLANPIFPAPVIARFCPGNAVADAVMKALAPAVPEQVSAGIGNLTVIAFSGVLNEQQWVHMEILEGSYGGRSGLDGMDTVDTLYANTRNNPIEDIESHLPLRVQRYELREDRAAPGEWRGGVGSVREFLYLTEGGFSVEGDGHKFRPWGFDGGSDGLPSALVQVASTGESIELPSKVPYRKAKAGDRLISYGPSGGGYGDPLLRAPDAVLENVLDGIVSAAQAREQYGVIIAAGSVEPAATEALRAELRRVRTGRAVGADAPSQGN